MERLPSSASYRVCETLLPESLSGLNSIADEAVADAGSVIKAM